MLPNPLERGTERKVLASLLLFVFSIWLGTTLTLAARPVVSLDEVTGLYATEGNAQPFQWTSNHVDIPVHEHSGATILELMLGSSRWLGRIAPQINLTADSHMQLTFKAPDQLRHYRIVLPADTRDVQLTTTVARSSLQDRRYLGVQLFGLSAQAYGQPTDAMTWALLPALASIPLVVLFSWCVYYGYGLLAMIIVLGLVLRIVGLHQAPPGPNQDELLSLVDAWHLARTGHDHLGHLLPLGALEGFGDWISPLLTYLELPFAAIAGPDPFVGRLLTALIGTLAIPAGYGLARALRLSATAALAIGLATAISPWQIFITRTAIPPALVPTSWTLCLLAAALLVQRGERRMAWWLALAAGLGIYAYPTMKLAVPLLVGCATLLALLRHGWHVASGWIAPALLLTLLWLPLGYTTLFNPANSNRLRQVELRANSAINWAAAWWNEYTIYFQPQFYFVDGDGDPSHGVQNRGVQLWVEAPLVALGLVSLLWRCQTQAHTAGDDAAHDDESSSSDEQVLSYLQTPLSGARQRTTGHTARRVRRYEWWLVTSALLIAPLPASLTIPNPYAYRAITIAPIYVLLLGLGVETIDRTIRRFMDRRWGRIARRVAIVLGAAALIWQGGEWYAAYLNYHPPGVAWTNQDGFLEAMQRAIERAADFDQVWIGTHSTIFPYIFLLAARPMPPALIPAQIALVRNPPRMNSVTDIGRYHFRNLSSLPDDLPVLDVIPDQFGNPAFIIQAWQHDGQRVLIVRRME